MALVIRRAATTAQWPGRKRPQADAVCRHATNDDVHLHALLLADFWGRQPTNLFVPLAPEHDVRREVCGSGFHHAVAEDSEIQALEHRLAPSEQDR
jgi:hypothetical protein